MDLIFYHGGINDNFTIDDLLILKPAEKQQKNNTNYAGFYMYDETNIEDAINYAIQENNRTNTTNKGLLKLYIDSNLKIYDYNKYHNDIFGITRIKIDDLKQLQEQGYDMIKGKIFNKNEYILLNKEKINKIEFINLEEKTNKYTK